LRGVESLGLGWNRAIRVQKAGKFMPRLGVNIDHVATVRQARRTFEPDPAWAATLAQLGGADAITFHLREDRRHIQDRDARVLKEIVHVKLNFECACTDEMLRIACDLRPHDALLVPENRQEVTTEGGLDVAGHVDAIARAVERLHAAGISVSLFIDPDERQIEAAQRTQADSIELHTGNYARAPGPAQAQQLDALRRAGQAAIGRGLHLHAGHGLTYANVRPVALIPGMRELNIGHSIVSRAVMVGMAQAVREMKALVQTADE
jgi:pyridoxine 5-phosphate synthase